MLNETKCTVATKEPTIDDNLNKLLGLVHQTADRADAIYGRLFRDIDAPCEPQSPNNPVECVESKIRLAIDKAESTAKILAEIQSQL